MTKVKFLVPVEEQERWKAEVEATPETEATMALLESIERHLDDEDTMPYGCLNPGMAQLFAKMVSP